MVEDEEIDFLPLFTTPSGESLDAPLSSLLSRAAGLINSQRIIAVSVVMMDADMDTSASRILSHPLAGPQLAQRLRAAADKIDRDAMIAQAPEHNRSDRVH